MWAISPLWPSHLESPWTEGESHHYSVPKNDSQSFGEIRDSEVWHVPDYNSNSLVVALQEIGYSSQLYDLIWLPEWTGKLLYRTNIKKDKLKKSPKWYRLSCRIKIYGRYYFAKLTRWIFSFFIIEVNCLFVIRCFKSKLHYFLVFINLWQPFSKVSTSLSQNLDLSLL